MATAPMPQEGTDAGRQGAMRAWALDQALANCTGCASPFMVWARAQLVAVPMPARGLMTEGLPECWRDVLGWSGMPLSPHGALRWGSDLDEDASLAGPVVRDGRLWLPAPERLAELSGLGLRPLRRFIADRFQVRLQTAPGVRLWLWPDRAVLVSLRDDTVGGFIYAPTSDQRSSVFLEPGGWQVVRY